MRWFVFLLAALLLSCSEDPEDDSGEIRQIELRVADRREIGTMERCPECEGLGRIIHRHDCKICSGTGKVEKLEICPRCNGEGWCDVTCARCAGSGKVTCGNRYTVYTRSQAGDIIRCVSGYLFYEKDDEPYTGKGVTIEPCRRCGGTGEVTCPVCRGTGAIRMKCENCDGSGRVSREVMCMECLGTGKIVREEPCRHCDGIGFISTSEEVVTNRKYRVFEVDRPDE